MDSTLERQKIKIKNLLNKTTDNGASEAEMVASLKKAKELMDKYSIQQSELPEDKKDRLVLKNTEKFTGFKIRGLLPVLCRLFDCKHYYTKKKVFFYGYEEDVNFCIHYYKVCVRLLLLEKENFYNTEQGKALLDFYHKRTVSKGFVTGFINSVCAKLDKMYYDLKTERNKHETSIIHIKAENVKKGFLSLNLNIRTKTIKEFVVAERAYKYGLDYGNNANLNYALESEFDDENKILLE